MQSNSIEKNFDQLAVVAKKPFLVGKKQYLPPENALKISANFWKKYNCYLGCGACCMYFSLDYIPEEIMKLQAEYPSITRVLKREIVVNSAVKTYYSVQHQPQTIRSSPKLFCGFLDLPSGACSIHEANPISCQIELMKFMYDHRHGVGRLQKRDYGRKWNMIRSVDGGRGAICDFSDFSEEQFMKTDLAILRGMVKWAEWFGIETWLPEMIDLLTNAYQAGDIGKEISVYDNRV